MAKQGAVAAGGGAAGWTRFQSVALVTLRIAIGWHFLYEGLAKLSNPYWTSAGYLAEAKGPLSGILLNIAASPSALTVVDNLNIWGQVLIGAALILGLMTRAATFAGIALLALYYLAAPPLFGFTYAMPTEGSYLLVNKVLIELLALLVLLAFPSQRVMGLDRLFAGRRTAEGSHE